MVEHLAGGQGVVGSNPARPTIDRVFDLMDIPVTTHWYKLTMGSRKWTDEHLRRAVATEQSWRGVMRALGLESSSSMRIVQQHADKLKLDTSHFSGQR